ncbi:MAG: glyceraldehyde-3-phosphate dehydrogenase [Bacteroidales bacterium]|nr:glyceraldehyde-3-phosphate dehydrogenase [Bacteroidales bacterium]
MSRLRIGIMGFGETGRHLYRACLKDDRVEVVAISDIGKPEILHYLLKTHLPKGKEVKLEGNHLVSSNGMARMVHGITPEHVPWDAFDVDFVVDATGKYKTRQQLEQHLKSGARRVVLASLPEDDIDRIAVMGVNHESIRPEDRIISSGSATTNAAALMIKALHEAFGVDYAVISSIHAYTADQPLRNVAGTDFRRSRSAAENIIPNFAPAVHWLQHVMPEMKGRIGGGALNVPVPEGSLLDLTTFLNKEFTLEGVHEVMEAAAAKYPELIEITRDPIVSTDVIGTSASLVYDVDAAMKSGKRLFKAIAWYHGYLSLAYRIKELMLLYHENDKKGGAR